jgi:V/A-type H+/Na+-transporting ATPase subunit C
MKSRTYPYTATRARAMKSFLLVKEDYMKMRKMGLNEMIRFLEENQYKKEIDQLSSEYKGMELINLALNENLANTINKLLMISAKESHGIIKNYAFRWVISNLKILVRTKDWSLAKKAIVPIDPTTYSFCESLIKKDNKEFVKSLKKITALDEEKFGKLYEDGEIIEMENELDRIYYKKLQESYNTIDPMLKEFYKFLIELADIKNIMKLKSIGVPAEKIRNLIITKSKLASSLLNENFEKSIVILKESKYRNFTDGIEDDFTRLESNIEKYLLQYSFRLLHLKPLTIAPIFGYLLAKEIEVRNLKLLINSKAMELDEEFVEENIIIH